MLLMTIIKFQPSQQWTANLPMKVFHKVFTIQHNHTGLTQMSAGTLTGQFLQEVADLPTATEQTSAYDKDFYPFI